MKACVEHDDVDSAISPETNVRNIGTRSNDVEFGIRRNVAKFWLSHPRATLQAKSFCVSLGKEL